VEVEGDDVDRWRWRWMTLIGGGGVAGDD